MEKFVIIHGHFYQPHRSNPWSGILLKEEDAAPANNWNERVLNECYLPNTRARISGPHGDMVEINNFETISFDIGPTLSRWMAENHMDTYRKIVEADRKSQNAIALPYNHTILPLDNEILQKAQIWWGMQAFQMHYGRSPQGMWLPECAVNYGVIEELIRCGMKYLFLSSFQAKAVKEIHDHYWHDVSNGSIDVRKPYRLFASAGYIDIFFSHVELSTDISFRRILDNPWEMATRIEKTFGHKSTEDSVLTIITDGETFGHHHQGAEKGLARLIKYELPSRGIKVTGCQKYLASHSPKWEVKIKDNSSWSCSHGLERWKSACGCGAEKGSNLQWREPLRASIAWLGEKALEVFLDRGREYFVSPIDAINNYGEILTNYSKLKDFHGKYVKAEHRGRVEPNKAMEVISNTAFMFTSCAWFFGSLVRLEPAQNLCSALRAMELLREVWGVDLEEEFYFRLNQHASVEDVWNNMVKSQRVEPWQIAKDFKEVFNYTGIRRQCWGYWMLDMVDSHKVRMESCGTGEILEF